MSYDCTWCKRRFHSVHAQWQHKYDKNHFDYECNCCDETYEIEKECVDHEIEDHYYCSECNRTFRNRSNIQQHLRSAAHIGSSITCPFCKRGFTTAASFVHHIENNGCSEAKSLDRDAIYQIVRQKDPSGVISKQVIVQTGSDFLQATDKAWNPDKGVYECDLCDRTFRQLQSLNHHLQSVTRAFVSSLRTRIV